MAAAFSFCHYTTIAGNGNNALALTNGYRPPAHAIFLERIFSLYSIRNVVYCFWLLIEWKRPVALVARKIIKTTFFHECLGWMPQIWMQRERKKNTSAANSPKKWIHSTPENIAESRFILKVQCGTHWSNINKSNNSIIWYNRKILSLRFLNHQQHHHHHRRRKREKKRRRGRFCSDARVWLEMPWIQFIYFSVCVHMHVICAHTGDTIHWRRIIFSQPQPVERWESQNEQVCSGTAPHVHSTEDSHTARLHLDQYYVQT